MLRKGTLHTRTPEALADGSFLSVTMINAPPHGVMVWAGRLSARAKDKAAVEITVDDYQTSEKVSFSQWCDVWEYFEDREYADLVARLREEVINHYPSD